MLRDMKKPLLDETLELARTSELPVVDICRAAGVTTRWYRMVLSGEIPDPSVRRVQRVHDYLAGTQSGGAV